MTVAVPGMNHPTPDTLAAFVDGRMTTAEHQEVLNHMADCAECLDVVLLTTEIVEAEAPASVVPDNVVRPRFRAKTWIPLAAAAAIVVVVGIPIMQERGGEGGPMKRVLRAWNEIPSFWGRLFSPLLGRVLVADPMQPVIQAWEATDLRPTAARISEGVPYKAQKRVLRGGGETDDFDADALKAEVALNAAQERVAEKETVESLHALGLAQMLAGKRSDAVNTLRKAEAMTPGLTAALLNDLAAAYLGNGDYDDALKTAERAWQAEQTPEAAWNRALALESLQRDTDAKAAWETYLKLDPNSPWANEVRTEHLNRFE